jgi:parvulin-like peptidyl-prolyl isomerase
MLKTMREGSAYFIKGVMLAVVVAFVGTIFVVWGVKSTPGDLARRGIVATVADTPISTDDYQQALRRQLDMYKQLLGDKADPKLLESMNIKQQVLNSLIRRILVRQYADRTGIGISTAELREEIERIPAFGGKDGFSKQRYLDVLRANRLAPDRFEADMREDLLIRKAESLIRDTVKVSDAEVRDVFQRLRRQIVVEVVQLPAGDEGKKLADLITLAIGKGKSLAVASQENGVTAKQLGPFPISAPDKDIPDPPAFRQAVSLLKPGETSPLVTGQKASYLIRLVKQVDAPEDDYEKEKASFRTQVLATKRESVFNDWLQQLRQTAKVTIDQDSL